MANIAKATAGNAETLYVILSPEEEAGFEAERTPSLEKAKAECKTKINEKASEIILAKYPMTKQLTNLRLGIDMSDMDLVRDYSNALTTLVDEAADVAAVLAIDIETGWPTI